MTKKSYIYISIMVLTIALGLGYAAQREYFAKAQAQRADYDRHFQINYEEIPLTPGSTAFSNIAEGENSLPEDRTYVSPQTKQLMADVELVARMEQEDAAKAAELKQRAATAINKYVNNPSIMRFNAEIAAAGVNADITQMTAQDFSSLTQNPKVMSIVIKYLQDKEFMAAMKAMTEDKELKAVEKEMRAANAAPLE